VRVSGTGAITSKSQKNRFVESQVIPRLWRLSEVETKTNATNYLSEVPKDSPARKELEAAILDYEMAGLLWTKVLKEDSVYLIDLGEELRAAPPAHILSEAPARVSQGSSRVRLFHGLEKLHEIFALTWKDIDFVRGRVTLLPGIAKSEEPRVFPFLFNLREILEAQKAKAETLQKKRGIICPLVFPSRTNARVVDYKKAWRIACRKAGCPGMFFHDFRRTAARNLERAGISRAVAMKMVGWESEAMYRRYNIVSESDYDLAAEKCEAFQEKESVTGIQSNPSETEKRAGAKKPRSVK
jgi:integrase